MLVKVNEIAFYIRYFSKKYDIGHKGGNMAIRTVDATFFTFSLTRKFALAISD